MRIRIHHQTLYRYAEPVYLGPHQVRLRPRDSHTVRALEHRLLIAPGHAPSWQLVLEGNVVASTWFDAATATLSLTSDSVVETLAHDPFDFLLDPGALELPVAHARAEARLLRPYLRRRGDTEAVDRLALAVRETAGPGTVSFLLALCREVNRRVRTVHRPLGKPRGAADTLAVGEGACRDTAVVLIDACRSQGLAARFVSGYLVEAAPPEGHDLHAWTEVYLPGAGWRGFDPSRGLAVDDRYVPVAVSFTPAGAAPVIGTYRGRVQGSMEITLQIDPVAT